MNAHASTPAAIDLQIVRTCHLNEKSFSARKSAPICGLMCWAARRNFIREARVLILGRSAIAFAFANLFQPYQLPIRIALGNSMQTVDLCALENQVITLAALRASRADKQ